MKVKKESIIFWFLLSIILFSTDTFVVFANIDRTVKIIFQLLIIFSIALHIKPFLIELLSFRLSKISVITCSYILMIVLLLLSMILNKDFSGGMFFKILVLTFGFSTATVLDRERAEIAIGKFISFLAKYSIIVYFASDLLKIFPLPYINDTWHTMMFVGFSNIDIQSSAIYRNYGPYWEPGVFQIYLIFGLIHIFSYRDKFKLLDIISCLVAVALTFSTTGYICTILILIGNFVKLEQLKTKSILKIFIFLCMLVFVGFIILEIPSVSHLLLSKFDSNNYEYISFSSRKASIILNIDAFLQGPILGIGEINLADMNVKFFSNYGTGYANTNGLLMNFSMFGILFGMIYLYLFNRYINSFCVGTQKNILKIVFIIEFFSEPLVYSILFNSLIFWHYKNKKL